MDQLRDSVGDALMRSKMGMDDTNHIVMASQNKRVIRGTINNGTDVLGMTMTSTTTNRPITTSSNNHSIVHNDVSSPMEFQRHDGVVIVTKIHGPKLMILVEQMICLLTKAYNERMRYDIIVFTTDPFSDENKTHIQSMGAPANVTVIQDNPGLQTMIEQLEPIRKQHFLQRCNITTPEQLAKLTWYATCWEDGEPHRLAYTWQAEFRALHIWNHPALQPYRYMLWMDTDGFCTEVWQRDPIAYLIEHQLVILFDNFPMGVSRGSGFAERYQAAFHTSLCGVNLVDGHLVANVGGDCPSPVVPHIHGFFHITDMDFYRSPPVQHWTKTLIGERFLSRKYDDQLGVTVPAAILAPNRSCEMEYHGIQLRVYHNGKLDGKQPVGGFKRFWQRNGKHSFPSAWKVCPTKAKH